MRDGQFGTLIAELFLIAGFLSNRLVSTICLLALSLFWSILAIYQLILENAYEKKLGELRNVKR